MQILIKHFVECLQVSTCSFLEARQCFLHLEQWHLPVLEEASRCLVSWRPGSVFYTWSSSRAHPPLAPPPWWRPADTCLGWWAPSASAGYPPHCHGPHIAVIRNRINLLYYSWFYMYIIKSVFSFLLYITIFFNPIWLVCIFDFFFEIQSLLIYYAQKIIF